MVCKMYHVTTVAMAHHTTCFRGSRLTSSTLFLSLTMCLLPPLHGQPTPRRPPMTFQDGHFVTGQTPVKYVDPIALLDFYSALGFAQDNPGTVSDLEFVLNDTGEYSAYGSSKTIFNTKRP